MNKKYQERPVSLNQAQQIIDEYNLGMKKNEIKKKYKITDSQFASIIKNTISTEEIKFIQAHPKHFRLND